MLAWRAFSGFFDVIVPDIFEVWMLD